MKEFDVALSSHERDSAISCRSVLAEVEDVLPAERRVGRDILFEPERDTAELAHEVSAAKVDLGEEGARGGPCHAVVLRGGPDEGCIHYQNHAAAERRQGVMQDASPAQVVLEHVPQEEAVGCRGIAGQVGGVVAGRATGRGRCPSSSPRARIA